MIRGALWTLRQRRYAALAALMVVVAALCVVAGTWQVSRYEQKVRDNDALRANAHAAPVALTTGLVPLVGHGNGPSKEAIGFRTVDVTGTYLPGAQQYVRGAQVGGSDGYYVLDPLRTASGPVLLVVRGFVAGHGVPHVGPPPPGSVQLRARLETADGGSAAGTPDHGVVDAIKPAAQASRIGAPVYDAYATLRGSQPGTAGLTRIPPPDLSNPAGGAAEWQHLAYIVQWYLFALLALAAPFAVARSEIRDARRRFLGYDEGEEQFDAPAMAELDAAVAPLELEGATADGVLARRDAGELARADELAELRWQQAAELADRYGRSLGTERPAAVRARAVRRPSGGPTRPGLDFEAHSNELYRSEDGYQGEYNDYLWQLALADGNMPEAGLDLGSADESPASPPDAGDPRHQ